ncbi:Trp biosynthesis-associated membrane protein [Nonomuraea sp. NPDC049309]|uniref:Trp biosynthesis-associated membrane protein n=1 Tax=Nonomuraea sp. NPDC049309 TaxID=3364350 RepID=UPI003724795D
MRSDKRELSIWVAATALGCLLVLLAAGREWARVLQAGAAAPTGGDLSPVLTPVALAGLAGVVAVLATRGTGRRVVGAVLALCGAGVAAAVWAAIDDANVTGWLGERDVLHGSSGVPWEAAPLWPAVAAAGALLMLAGGITAIARGPRWAGMSARYDRAQGTDGEAKAQVSDDRALWDALDRGDDPTEGR